MKLTSLTPRRLATARPSSPKPWSPCRLVIFAAATLATLPLGCASARRNPPLAEPVNVSEPALARGEEVFMRHCNQCHPGGAGGLGPALNDKPFFGWAIKYQVRNGLGVMPYFSKAKISDTELDDVVHYLVALRNVKQVPEAEQR